MCIAHHRLQPIEQADLGLGPLRKYVLICVPTFTGYLDSRDPEGLGQHDDMAVVIPFVHGLHFLKTELLDSLPPPTPPNDEVLEDLLSQCK